MKLSLCIRFRELVRSCASSFLTGASLHRQTEMPSRTTRAVSSPPSDRLPWSGELCHDCLIAFGQGPVPIISYVLSILLSLAIQGLHL